MYKDALRNCSRDPQFLLKIIGFIVFTIYAVCPIAIDYANRDAARIPSI